LERKQQLVLIMLAAVILFGSGYKYAQWHIRSMQEDAGVIMSSSGQEPNNKSGGEIVVHVQGAVERPGVYHLPAGARVADAVERAVALPEAEPGSLNLAEVLKDGRKITIPAKQVVNEQAAAGAALVPQQPGAEAAGSGAGVGGLVNINTAGLAELETLPGIGPSLAQRIISYREDNGAYTDTEDIKKVSGIGNKRYEQLKDLITVN
jgi:competence protein ComEA